tara:strand:- start:389 stop:646 length:258 start_codon:yes stop_codon:yes gene_type:complete
MNEIQFNKLTDQEKNNLDRAIAPYLRLENMIEKTLLMNEFVHLKYDIKGTTKRSFKNALTSNIKYQIKLSPALYSNKHIKFLANF